MSSIRGVLPLTALALRSPEGRHGGQIIEEVCAGEAGLGGGAAVGRAVGGGVAGGGEEEGVGRGLVLLGWTHGPAVHRTSEYNKNIILNMF